MTTKSKLNELKVEDLYSRYTLNNNSHPIMNRPMLQYFVKIIASQGFSRIYNNYFKLTLNHLRCHNFIHNNVPLCSKKKMKKVVFFTNYCTTHKLLCRSRPMQQNYIIKQNV